MRFLDELVASLSDVVPGEVAGMVFFSFLATVIIALLWYFYPYRGLFGGSGSRSQRRDRSNRPAGQRRFRLGRLRWRLRWRRRKKKPTPAEELDELAPDELPDLPADVLLSTADQLALAGRYREAVRERLRAIIRSLIDQGVLPPTPGWTVTELAAAAGLARPPLAPPLAGATGVFSEIWYGLRTATQEDDLALRAHAAAVEQILAQAPVPAGSPA